MKICNKFIKQIRKIFTANHVGVTRKKYNRSCWGDQGRLSGCLAPEFDFGLGLPVGHIPWEAGETWYHCHCCRPPGNRHTWQGPASWRTAQSAQAAVVCPVLSSCSCDKISPELATVTQIGMFADTCRHRDRLPFEPARLGEAVSTETTRHHSLTAAMCRGCSTAEASEPASEHCQLITESDLLPFKSSSLPVWQFFRLAKYVEYSKNRKSHAEYQWAH